MAALVVRIYCLPIRVFISGAILALLVWSFGYATAHGRGWRRLNLCVLLISAAALLYLAIFQRTPGTTRLIIWEPLYSLREARLYKEYYRLMLLNTLVFMPLGLTVPALLPRKCSRHTRVLLTVLIAFFVSAMIEAAQYWFSLGNTETDDVIFNTLGGLLGGLTALAEPKTPPPENEGKPE